MDRIALAIGAALCAACVPYQSLETEMFYSSKPDKLGALPRSLADVVAGAEDLTHYSVVLVRKAPIQIEIVTGDPVIRGRYWRKGVCDHRIRSTPNSAVLAHEIGHTLGLDHVDGVDNIMSSKGTRDDGQGFTDGQRDRMRRFAKRIERWCWDSSEPEWRNAVAEGDGDGVVGEVVCELK